MPRWRAPNLTPDEHAALDQIEAIDWGAPPTMPVPDTPKQESAASKRSRKKPQADPKDQFKFS